MFEKRIGYPPAGTNQPDWMWKKPTVWTHITYAVGMLVLLTVLGLGVWGLIVSLSHV